MTNALIGLGLALAFLATYAAIGIAYARRSAVETYRSKFAEHRRRWTYTPDERIAEWARRDTREALATQALFWPFYMIGMLFVGLGNGSTGLLMGPIEQRQRQAEKLRADAKAWTDVAAEEVDLEKKSMAEELARILGDQAKEVDLHEDR